jgi:hypothetical protein
MDIVHTGEQTTQRRRHPHQPRQVCKHIQAHTRAAAAQAPHLVHRGAVRRSYKVRVWVSNGGGNNDKVHVRHVGRQGGAIPNWDRRLHEKNRTGATVSARAHAKRADTCNTHIHSLTNMQRGIHSAPATYTGLAHTQHSFHSNAQGQAPPLSPPPTPTTTPRQCSTRTHLGRFEEHVLGHELGRPHDAGLDLPQAWTKGQNNVLLFTRRGQVAAVRRLRQGRRAVGVVPQDLHTHLRAPTDARVQAYQEGTHTAACGDRGSVSIPCGHSVDGGYALALDRTPPMRPRWGQHPYNTFAQQASAECAENWACCTHPKPTPAQKRKRHKHP